VVGAQRHTRQLLGDPTDDQRCRWVAAQRERGVPEDFALDRSDLGGGFSCLIAGDTGEGTHTQFVVVPGLLEAGNGTSFLVVMSDVIYPIGNSNEYIDKFFRPYSNLKLAFGTSLLEIAPAQASSLIAARCRMKPTRGGTVRPTLATRTKGTLVGLLPSGHTFHKYLSEFVTWVDPPLFKSFLRLDVTPTEIRIRCFAATGCREQELNPPVEDDFTITLDGRGG
jgi:hypothetical protein